MITNEEVGRRIRQAREEKGLLQSDLGRLLSRPRSHAAVSDIERGKTRLDLEELSEIARLLGKPLDFFTGSRPIQAVVYRRSERGLSAEQQKETDRAIEAFKRLAREQARRRAEGDA